MNFIVSALRKGAQKSPREVLKLFNALELPDREKLIKALGLSIRDKGIKSLVLCGAKWDQY